MKNFVSTLLVVLCAISFTFAQTSSKKVFSTTKLVWYGLDYSQVRLIDGAGFPYPEEVKTKYVRAWNSLIVNEQDKYDIKKHFQKSQVDFDLKSVNEANKTIDEEQLVTYDSYEIEKEKVQEMIKSYTTKAEKGIGLVFIVESLDKVGEAAHTHVTFFDIATKEIIFHEKMAGRPGGFGLRNFWAGSVMDLFKQCKKNWKSWAKSQ